MNDPFLPDDERGDLIMPSFRRRDLHGNPAAVRHRTPGRRLIGRLLPGKYSPPLPGRLTARQTFLIPSPLARFAATRTIRIRGKRLPEVENPRLFIRG